MELEKVKYFNEFETRNSLKIDTWKFQEQKKFEPIEKLLSKNLIVFNTLLFSFWKVSKT